MNVGPTPFSYVIAIFELSTKNRFRILDFLKSQKKKQAKKQVVLRSIFEEIPRRLWEKFVIAAEIPIDSQWAQLNNKQLENLATINKKNCISIYIPTHRTGNNLEDNIRFKNALSDAQNKLLEKGMSKNEASEYLAKGYELLDKN